MQNIYFIIIIINLIADLDKYIKMSDTIEAIFEALPMGII